MHHELVFVDISLRTYVHVRVFGVQCFRKYCVSQNKITPGVKPNRLSVKRKKETCVRSPSNQSRHTHKLWLDFGRDTNLIHKDVGHLKLWRKEMKPGFSLVQNCIWKTERRQLWPRYSCVNTKTKAFVVTPRAAQSVGNLKRKRNT